MQWLEHVPRQSDASELAARTRSEWLLLHRLHPSERTVFVEGDTDRAFFRRCVAEFGAETVKVYGETSVISPRNAGEAEGGSRGRLIRFAMEAEERNDLGLAFGVLIVVDADLDRHLGATAELRCLCYTDYPELESYFLSEACLRRFLRRWLNTDGGSLEDFIAVRVPLMCSLLFAARAALRTVNGAVKFPSKATECFVIDEVRTELGGDCLASKLVSVIGHAATEEFLKVFDAMQLLMPSDLRERCLKKDWLELAAQVIKRRGPKHLRGVGFGPSTLQDALLAVVEPSDIEGTELSRRLLGFCAKS